MPPSNSEEERVTQLAGRVALVTGAGRGIGRATSIALAAAGAAVVATARSTAELDAVVAGIRATSAKRRGQVLYVDGGFLADHGVQVRGWTGGHRPARARPDRRRAGLSQERGAPLPGAGARRAGSCPSS
jgi:hypothetical protein